MYSSTGGASIMKLVNWLTVALCAPLVITCVELMAISVALRQIIQEFSSTIETAQWLISAYTLGIASFLIVIGRLADLYGRRRLLIIGIVLFGLISALATVSMTMPQLIACRFIQGVASSMISTTVISIITHHFPKEIRSSMIAKWSISIGVGLSAGPLVGAMLIYFFSWRAIFFINIPACLWALYLVVRYIPESKDLNATIKINWFEAIVLSLFMLALISLLSEIGVVSWHSVFMVVAFLVVISSGLILAINHFLKRSSLIDFSLFRLKNFSGAVFSGTISYFYMYAWLFVLGVFLQEGLHLSPIRVGLTFIAFSIASAITAQYLKYFIARFSGKQSMQSGFLLAMLSFLWMWTITVSTPMSELIFMFAMLGASITMVNVPSMTVATQHIPPEKVGVASGTIFTLRWFGGTLGVALTTLIFYFFSETKHSLEAGLHYSCLWLVLVTLMGFIFTSRMIQQT